MSHTPTTFRGETGDQGLDWQQACALHHAGDDGVLSDVTAARHGALADLVRYVALLSAEQRKGMEISISGDHRLKAHEIMALYARSDFPHAA